MHVRSGYSRPSVPPPPQSTPLHLAAGYNRTGVVQLLLKHGADVHAKDKGSVLPATWLPCR